MTKPNDWWVGPQDPTQQWTHIVSGLPANVPGPVWVTHPALIEYKKARQQKR
jgi:hypothetical protein